MRRIVAALLTLTFILSMGLTLVPYAQDVDEILPQPDEITLPELEIYIVDRDTGVETEYESGMEYRKGDLFKIEIYYPEGYIPDNIELPDFYLDLGGLNITSELYGTLPGDTPEDPHGTWEIKDGRIYFFFSDAFKNGNIRSFGVRIEGEIPLDADEDPEGIEKSVKIAGHEFTVRPKYDDSQATATKEMGPITLQEDGRFLSRAIIKIGITEGNVTDLYITDELSDPLLLPENPNWRFTHRAKSGEETDVTDEYLNYITINNNGFDLNIPGPLHDNEWLFIEYDVEITLEDFVKGLEDGMNFSASNEIRGGYTDNHDQENDFGGALVELPVIRPEIAKTSTTETTEGEGFLITWKVTFKSGSLGVLDQLTDAQKAALGLENDVIFVDRLGEGLTVTPEFAEFVEETTNEDGETVYELKIPLDRFTKSEEADKNGSYTYTFVYQTTADGDKMEYQNDVGVDFPHLGGYWTTGTAGVPLHFTKSFVEKTTELTMKWQILTNIPDKFDTISITDTPQQDQTNKPEYTHRYVKGSLKILVTTTTEEETVTETYTVEMLTQMGVLVEEGPESNPNGFMITFLSEAENNEFVALMRGKSDFVIEYETEAVKPVGNEDAGEGSTEWSREDSLEGDYYWVNRADEKIIRGDEVVNKTGRDYLLHNKTPEFVKYGKGSGTNTPTMRFYIYIKGQPILDFDTYYDEESGIYRTVLQKDTALFQGGYTFQLLDTLPKYTTFCEGAYVTLRSLSRKTDVLELEATKELMKCFKAEKIAGDPETGEQILFTFDSDLYESDEYESLEEYLVANYGSRNYDQYLEVWYEIEIVNYDALKKNGKYFTNTVDGDVNGEDGKTDSATISFTERMTLVKSSIYDQSMENDKTLDSRFMKTLTDRLNIYFYTHINEQKFTLGLGGKITVKDTMGKSLRLVEESIKLINADTNEEIDIDPDALHIDWDENSLVLELDDKTSYILSYWCEITDDPIGKTGSGRAIFGPLQDARNTIEITADYIDLSSWTEAPDAVLTPSGWASMNDSYYLDIFKYTGKNTPLEGAVFELVKGDFDGEGKFVQVGDPMPVVEQEPDPEHPEAAKGYTTFLIDSYDSSVYIYRLREIKAPDGYKRDRTVYYFVLPSYNGIIDAETNELPAELLAYGVKVQTSGIIFFKNNPVEDNGMLTVEKNVSGTAGELDRYFTFTVTLSDKRINGQYGDMFFEEGVATVKLKHGDSVTATGLPEELTYTVEESDNEGYTVTAVDDTGEITAEGAVAVFHNHKDAETEDPEDPETPPTEEPGPGVTPPATGDKSHVGFWFTVMILSFVGLVITLIYPKRNKE